MLANIGKTLLRYIVAILVIGVAAFLLTNGTRFLNENNTMQQEAKIALEDYISSGKEFPTGEFVSLNARWVLGPFATETSTSTTNGIQATSGVAYYYFLVLEDETLMALKAENTKECETLNRMSDWLLEQDGFPRNGETLKVQGKLTALKDAELKEMYHNDALSIFGLSAGDPALRDLVLDTTAGREMLYYIIFGAVIVLILGFILFRRSRKKAEPPVQEETPAPEETPTPEEDVSEGGSSL